MSTVDSGRKLEQVDLHIEGMTCSSCVATVERALNKVPGVQASVNLVTETAHVLAPEGTKTSTLISAVEGSGYDAKLKSDESESFANSRGLGLRVLFAALFTIPIVAISMWHQLHMRVDEFLLNQLNAWNLPTPLYSASGWLVIALSAPVVLILAWPIHRVALRNLLHPTMDNLISVGSLTAFSWSIYANSTGAGDIYAEVASSVVTLIILGRYLESRAKKRAGSALAHLLSLNPKEVTIIRGGEEVISPIASLEIGDHCVVRPGDRFPTDGVVIEGKSSVDASLVTGESNPIDVAPGSSVIAGTINQGGRLIIEARRVGSDTELSRMTKMVLAAQAEKSPIQRIADRISGIFVPIVILLSIGTLVAWLLLGHPLQDAISAAVALLVIACPCALGLATPVAILVASGRGASLGIVLRKPSALEVAPKITTAVFDKTGTLTTGVMRVISATSSVLNGVANTQLKIDPRECANAIYTVARESNHPVSQSIARYYQSEGGSALPFSELIETPGQGIAARISIGNQHLPVLLGAPDSIRRATLGFPHEIDDAINSARARGNSTVVAAIDGIPVAAYEVGDSIKSDARDAILALHNRGIETWLLTGDSLAAASTIADAAGIPASRVIAQASPERKIEKIKELRRDGAKVMMIGDGVNDAAALAEADLSIAMGTGTDTAISVADITVMRSDLTTVIAALDLSKRTLSTINMNLGWAFIYNVIGMPIAALGLLNPMYAGGAMALSSLFVVFNSLRLNK